MKILVLGASGFIGSHLCEALLQQGYYVRGFSRTLSSHLIFLLDSHKNFEWIGGSWDKPDDLMGVMTDINVVFHLISSNTPISSTNNISEEFNRNINNTFRLLDIMKSYDVGKIVYLSSGGAVYGQQSIIPTPETATTNPVSPYGITKLTIEKIVHMYWHMYGLSYSIFRPSNVFGPRQNIEKKQGVISIFIRQVLESKPIEIWGSSSIRKDYIYIDDCISAMIKSLSYQDSCLFNLGSSVGISLEEIFTYIFQIHGSSVDVIYRPPIHHDVPLSILDTTHLKQILQWDCKTDFLSGIKNTYAYIKKTLKTK